MRQFDITDHNKLLEYEEGYSQGFKAGMLAAADLIYKDDYTNPTRRSCAKEIRKAANGNSNNS